MTAEPFRCAASSEGRDEPLYGTASFVRRWLLLEQPGSWGSNALMQSRIPERTALELRRRAQAARARIVLIRRGVRLAGPKRQCYFAVTDLRETRLSEIELDSLDDLMDVDLSPLADGEPIAQAVPRTDPLFLVCTHGRHDACCSIRGNQVSRVACAEPGVDAWECSHIGGDRFAANLVAFPHGIYYGRVQPNDVVDLMSTYADGNLSLANYRGRCCYPFPLQAAEYFARRETAATGVVDLSLIESSVRQDRASARFALRAGGVADVEVRMSDSDGSYRLTCDAAGTSSIPRYDLDAFRHTPGATEAVSG